MDTLEYDNSITAKNNALYMIGQLVLWGDMQAFMLVNFSDVFEVMTKKLVRKDKDKWTIYE